MLYEQNADREMLIASTTKIMTALVAIREGTLTDSVRVSRAAAYTEGSSMYLKEGEKLTLETLLYGLLLSSGNDAALAVADAVAGGTAEFVSMMNQKAAAPVNSEEICLGEFRLNLRRRTLTKNDKNIELTQVEFQMMEYFFTNAGAALSRTAILNRVWGDEYFGEEKIVDVNIRRLRMKVEDEPHFAYRGFMLDSARHMQTVDEIKKLIVEEGFEEFNYSIFEGEKQDLEDELDEKLGYGSVEEFASAMLTEFTGHDPNMGEVLSLKDDLEKLLTTKYNISLGNL